MLFFFFQAEDGIRDLVRSRGLGDVYKRQGDTLESKFKELMDDTDFVIAISYSTGDTRRVKYLSLIHI